MRTVPHNFLQKGQKKPVILIPHILLLRLAVVTCMVASTNGVPDLSASLGVISAPISLSTSFQHFSCEIPQAT